jgi:hypothetical protein
MPAKVELDTLMREANETAALHSHRMGPTTYFSFTRATSQCEDCGMEAYAITKPWPNEIKISGEAVALNCPAAGGDASAARI